MEKYINEFHDLVKLTLKLDELMNIIDKENIENYSLNYNEKLFFLCKKIKQFLKYYLYNTDPYAFLKADYTEISFWISNINKFIIEPITVSVKNKKILYSCQRLVLLDLSLSIRNACLREKISSEFSYERETKQLIFESHLSEAI